MSNGIGARSAVRTLARPPDPSGVWWIDDLGSWNPVDPKSEAAHLRRPLSATPAHNTYAYGMLGLVKLQARRRRVAVKWNLRKVAPESLAAAIDFLDGHRAGRPVNLTFYYEGWNAETWPDEAAAIARIRQVAAYRDIPLVDTVFVKAQGLDALPGGTPLIRRGFELWDRSRGRLDPARQPCWQEIRRRLLLYQPDRAGSLILLEAGLEADCRKVFHRGWAAAARNRPCDHEYPSRRFGERVSPAYARVIDTREPWLDHVRPLIPGTGREPVWAPYQRLVLPVRLADGSPAIAVLSNLTQQIAIPFLAGSA